MCENNRLIIGYDKGYGKELSALVIIKEDNDKLYLINMFKGIEADELHNKLTNSSISEVRKYGKGIVESK